MENRLAKHKGPAKIQVLLTKLCLEFRCFLRPGLAPCVEKSLDTKWFQTPSYGLAWWQGVKSQRLFPSPQRARAGTAPSGSREGEPLGGGLGGKVLSSVS